VNSGNGLTRPLLFDRSPPLLRPLQRRRVRRGHEGLEQAPLHLVRRVVLERLLRQGQRPLQHRRPVPPRLLLPPLAGQEVL